MLNYVPKYFSNRAIALYFIGLTVVTVLFIQHAMPLQFMFIGAFSVVCFFYFSNKLPLKWAKLSTKKFEKKLFWYVVLLRFSWIFIFYGYTMTFWGTPWEQPIGTAIDSFGFWNWGQETGEFIRRGELVEITIATYEAGWLDDFGYPIILGFISLIFGESIIASRFLHPFFDAWMAILLYRLAVRNFGEATGRLSAIFVMLMPLLIFYSGVTMKESTMTMIVVWFLERMDATLRGNKISVINIVVSILLASSFFLFRDVLSLVAIMAVLGAITFTHSKVVGWKKKVLIGLFIVSVGGVILGGHVASQLEQTIEQREGAGDANLQNRARQNELAGRLTEIAFAPLMFTIPFPTMINIPHQPIQQMLNGAFYIKNILSFFVILILFVLLKNNNWRKYALCIFFMCGYLAVLAFSPFAHSGRFHVPIVPIQLMFAAFAICNITKKQAQWFNYFLVLQFMTMIFWNWFKLAGRGII